MERRLLHLRLAARWLGVPASWLRTEALGGRVPSLKAGRGFLFDIEAVEESLLIRARGGGTQDADDPSAVGEGES
jgi:hypothetical protein